MSLPYCRKLGADKTHRSDYAGQPACGARIKTCLEQTAILIEDEKCQRCFKEKQDGQR